MDINFLIGALRRYVRRAVHARAHAGRAVDYRCTVAVP